MITNLVNPAQKLSLGVASSTITFSTDATAPIQTTATSTANGTNMTLASGLGMYQGGFLSIEGGGLNGTVPWVVILGASNTNFNNASQSVGAGFPSVRTSVTNAVANFFERFETRYKAKKITLTNLTNGDVYVWDTTLLDNQAKYTPSGGATTTLTSNAIVNRPNCIAIHPNILPANSNYSMQSDYEYRDASVSDTTAPTLTSPSGTATSATTATLSVTTNEAGGTLYYLASTSATATAAAVMAGYSQAVTAAGAQSASVTGLTASTVYYPHFVHSDGAGNVSVVSDGAAFTTQAATAPADTTAPTLSAATAAPNGAYAATGSVTTNEGNGTLYYLASASTSLTAAQVKSGATQAISSAGAKSVAVSSLTAATVYYLHFLHRDAAGNESVVLRSASFTTAAIPSTLATLVTFPVVDAGGAPVTGLVNLDYAFYDQPRISAGTAPVKFGTTFSVSNGVASISIAGATTLAPGGIGRIEFGDSALLKAAIGQVTVS